MCSQSSSGDRREAGVAEGGVEGVGGDVVGERPARLHRADAPEQPAVAAQGDERGARRRRPRRARRPGRGGGGAPSSRARRTVDAGEATAASGGWRGRGRVAHGHRLTRPRRRRSRRPAAGRRRCRPRCAGRAARPAGCRRSASTQQAPEREGAARPVGLDLAPPPGHDGGRGGGVEGVGGGVVVVVAEVGADDHERLGAAPQPVEQRGDRLGRRPGRRRRGRATSRSPSATWRNGQVHLEAVLLGVGAVVDDDVGQRRRCVGSAAASSGTEPERGGEGVDVGQGHRPQRHPVVGPEQHDPLDLVAPGQDPGVGAGGDRPRVHVAGVGHDQRVGGGRWPAPGAGSTASARSARTMASSSSGSAG